MYYTPALLSDLPLIVDIYNSTIPGRMATADTEPVTVESKTEWFHQHNPQTRPLWMIRSNQDEVVGWASFTTFKNRPAYNATVEISIYVHEDFRGKGLGREILEYCIQAAPQYGVRNLIGLIFAHNTPSISLFTNCGFDVWGNLPGVCLVDGLPRDVIIMGKKV